ncbi:hypothetical protein POTOM_055086 [Populus tomentosa]|uniref:Expansin-like CBD domain-containing protein n=1 Tax=Populus tomentosa TaxID=118781 RepID=A0A8X7Y2Q5_POPTO|nr:hypothetical protein POTOM_055086 [Populus tomentosa]
MASFKNSFACLVLMALLGVARSGQISFGEKIDSSWHDAHATFYGDIKGGQTMSTFVCVCVCVYIYIYFFHIKFYLFILCSFLLVKTTDIILCSKEGGVKFDIHGNPYWMLVLVRNVAGAGEVINVRIKGSQTRWIQMSRNWGQNWQTGTDLVGQSLSFLVTTSDYKRLYFNDVAGADWSFGQAYDGKTNF